MNLVQPLALAFLGLLPVIVILHLLHQRHRPLVVPSLQHWLKLAEPILGQRWKRLPITLLLLLHLLVAALLAVALARPQFPSYAMLGAPTHTIWMVDTSTSMDATDITPSRLGAAQQEIRQGLDRMSSRDSATLITMGGKAEMRAHAEPGDQVAVEAALAGLQAAGVGTDLSGALDLATGLLRPGFKNQIVVLTDAAFRAVLQRAPAPVTWRTFGKRTANQAVVVFSSRRLSNGGTQVFTRIANFSASAVQRMVRLTADPQPNGRPGRMLDATTATLPAEGEYDQSWEVPPGVQVVQVELLGRDALPDDDRAVLSLSGQTRRSAVLVEPTGHSPSSLERALRAVPDLDVRVETPDNYRTSPNTDLTVFDSYLPSDPPPGGTLVVNPPAGSDWLPVLAETGGLAIAGSDDPLVAGIDLSSVHFDRIEELNLPSWIHPALSAGQIPLMARGEMSQTQVVVWAFDPARSNLPNKLAFPLLVARSVAELLPARLPDSVTTGQPVWLPAGSTQMSGGVDGQMEPISGNALIPVRPGLYTVQGQWPDGRPWQGQFAVNAGDPAESDLRPQPLPQITQLPAQNGSAGVAVDLRAAQTDVWPWLAALAALILLAEGWWAWH